MGIGRARRLFKRARNHFFPGALILLYHRVGEPDLDPQLLSVSRRNFEEHLQALRKFRTVSLNSLPPSERNQSSCVALTFDDGYADNLWNAKPLLGKYGAPATMFVSAGHVVDRRSYWWDELQRLLLHSNKLPETLAVTVDGARRRWVLGDPVESRDGGLSNREWNVLVESDPSPRHKAYRDLCDLMRELPPDRQGSVLDEIRSEIAVGSDFKSDACTPDEIRRLHEPGLIEIGAHACTHPMLSRLPVGEQWQEISRSKELLEEIIGSPVESFSYPYGGRQDYGAETVDCVRRCGFKRACSNFAGHVRGSTDPFELPRYLVRNWDGDTFARKLENWLHG